MSIYTVLDCNKCLMKDKWGFLVVVRGFFGCVVCFGVRFFKKLYFPKIISPNMIQVQKPKYYFTYEKLGDNDGYIMGEKYRCYCTW